MIELTRADALGPSLEKAKGYSVLNPTPFFDGRALEQAGYTYEFLDPDGVSDPAAAGDGALYPDGPAYRAIVVDTRAMPGAAAAALAQAAQHGLAVVFVGSPPNRGTGNTSPRTEDRQVRDAVQAVMASGRARRVTSDAAVLGAESVALAQCMVD